MPSWSAENDLKLATAIIALHQVKVNKDDCDRLATIIGEGCTPKAITHRVTKFREAASKLGLQDNVPLPATPPTVKKRARNTKADQDQDGHGADAGPKKKRVQTPKVKKSPAPVENDGADEEKTVKKEMGEDDGEVAV